MNLDETEQLAADMRAAHLIKTLMERNKELEASLQKLQSDYDAVGAGGVSAQRVMQSADHIAQDRKMVAAPVVLPEPAAVVDYYSQGGENDQISAFLPIGTKLYTEEQVRELLDKAACTKSQTTAQEPFGYFKAEPFGWRDCAETDEGAIALYEAPQPQADALDAQRWLDYLIRNQARVCNNLDEYEGDEDCADCGYWLEFTDSNSQRRVQIGIFKTPRDAIDTAITAEKEMK